MATLSSVIRPEHKVVLIKIPRLAGLNEDAVALFEGTSKWWVVSEARREGGPASPEYALAVLRGRVVVAYRISGWQRAPAGARWGFSGEVSEELTTLYAGMDVTPYFPPGAANPLRYVNCGVSPRVVGRPQPPDHEVVTARHSELAEKVSRLKKEPLTHLMLGHRELFHSNLLAWFFENQPERADRVFASLTRPAVVAGRRRQVLREKDHLDLLFRWPDRQPVVVENKVFSLPDEAQLARYGERACAGGEDPALWLLSLTDPSWLEDRKTIGGHEWRRLDFRYLAERIREAVPPEDQAYESQTMRRYADVVELLTDVVEEVVVSEPEEPVSMPPDVEEALGERLASTLSKLRALSVAQELTQALKEAAVELTEVESGYSKGEPHLSWFAPIDAAPGARAGWQLQGGQFRLALVTPHLHGKTAAKREDRFAFARANEGLFDFGAIDEILGTSEAPLMPAPVPGKPLGFNRFDPNFTYRYKRAPDLTVAQLEAAAVAIARRKIR